ncbi:MAG: putative 4-mercaptohistidine N1-methyltransferase [Spartobacteria bacterium]
MSNPYESRRLVDEYLFFHYATFAEAAGTLPVPHEAWGFPTRVVTGLLDASGTAERALDIGCAVGASSFELARWIPGVTGIDFSSAFIRAAGELKNKGNLEASVAFEGRRLQNFTARVPEEIDRQRVLFEPGDAMNLRSDLGAFDVVLAANLVCRLPEPLRFIERLADLVAPGGQLLLATPFSWLPEFTPEENWLGGTEDAAPSREILADLLRPAFELELAKDLPFLIREHSRKFQYGISLGTRWRRR